jgi:hypothetical protein
MAYWQFQFSIVPSSGIEKVHGHQILRLPEYESRDSNEDIKDIESFNNYWQGIDLPQGEIHELMQLLPVSQSWDDSASMFADVDGNTIEIWADDINCALSLSNPRFDLLSQIISIAARMRCMIILKDGGKIIAPDFAIVADEIMRSSAKKFLDDPSKLIRSR